MAKRKSVWTEPSRYGTYEGERGSPEQWAGTFSAAFDKSDTIKSIIGMSAYEVLGLLPAATDEDVQKAYRKLARLHHPDHDGDRTKFETATTAYNTIKTLRSASTPSHILRPATVSTPQSTPADSDLIIPQLLTEIDESEIERFLTDDDYGAQEKKDGRHLTLQLLNDQFFVRNKKGIASSCEPLFESSLRAQSSTRILIDGEHIGNNFWVWDALELVQDLRNLSYIDRCARLWATTFGPAIKIVPLSIGTQSKRDLYNSLKTAGKEGIVFKKLSGIFRPGKGDDQFKFKFYSECSVIVVPGRPGKASIGMELLDANGNREFVGYCSCNRNPPIGSIAEIKYLYAYHGGCLYQSAFKELRDDVDISECTTAQLKYKHED